MAPTHHVHSELLNFIDQYRGTLTQVQMKECVSKHFDENEILSARQLLIDTFGDNSKYPNRRGTKSASVSDQNLDDIYSIFDKFRTDNDFNDVTFYSIDLKKLPFFAFSPQLKNSDAITVQIEKLTKAQQHSQKAFDKLSNHVKNIENKLAAPQELLLPSQTGLLSNPMNTHYSDAVRHRMIGNADGSSLDLLGGNKPPTRLSIPFSAASQGALKDSNGEFETQRYDRLKQQRKYRRDQKAVVGSNSDETIKSGRKTVDLFVFRIHNDIEDDNVKTYIDEKVSLDRFQKMSNCEAPMKSYKFTINADDENEVMKTEFWPKGVRCRRFIYKRQISEPNGFNRGSADNPING